MPRTRNVLIGAAAIAGVLAYLSYSESDPLDHSRLVTDGPIFNPGEIIDINGKSVYTVYLKHPTSTTCILFMHGMGGQLGQFESQIAHFSKRYSVLAIDLVGHGQSPNTNNPEHYQSDSLAQDLAFVLRLYCAKYSNVICIGHSYGCALVARMYTELSEQEKSMIKGVVLLGPTSRLGLKDTESAKTVAKIPDFILDFMRYIDRWGGADSLSVRRILGPEADILVRQKQLLYNRFTPTPVIKQTLSNATFTPKEMYAAIQAPMILIGGSYDKICPPDPNVNDIQMWSELPKDRVYILKTGHMMPLEDPVGVIDCIEKLLGMIHL